MAKTATRQAADANNWNVVDSKDGVFTLPHVGVDDIARIDIADVDLLIQTKSGEVFLLPRAGIDAMSDHPPQINLEGKIVGADVLINTIGTTLSDSTFLTSLSGDVNNPKLEDAAKLKQQLEQAQKHIKELQQEVQKQQQEEHKQDEKQQHSEQAQSEAQGSSQSASVEQMVETAKKITENLKISDYDYQPPPQAKPTPAAQVPAGVPPPISLTPVITLFMGNITETTSSVSGGVTTFLGGGGASGTGAEAHIGPRNAGQYSVTTITGTSGDDAIYASGNLGGNGANPSTLYAKEFQLNVAGYFTTLNDVQVTGIPAGVSLYVNGSAVAPNVDGSVTIPSDVVIHGGTFQLVYDATAASSTGTFDVTFNVSGHSTRNADFSASESVRFEFLPLNSAGQLNDTSLFYESNGILKEIYTLLTADNPNAIDAGDGNNTVVGGRSNDTIVANDGANSIVGGDGNDSILVGVGNNTIQGGAGADLIIAGVSGTGGNNISGGDGNDTITAGNGNNSVDAGDGNNIVATGSGNDTIVAGTGNNNINAGQGANFITVTGGANTITFGDGANTVNLGNGNSTITGGNGADNITLGVGFYNLTLGNGNDTVTATSGGGIFALGNGVNSITTGNGDYTITAGTGGSTVSVGNGTIGITLTGGANHVTAGDGLITITTGSGNDYMSAGTGTNVFRPGIGTDTIIGNATGNNTVDYTGISVALTASLAAGTVTGTGVNSNLTNITAFTGGEGNDSITGSTGANLIHGGNGNDTIRGNGGNDTLYGDGGDDSIVGGTGIDLIYGGTGNNTIDGGTAGADTLIGGIGNDSFINPHAGQHYIGTTATGLSAGESNSIDYSGTSTGVNINLASGDGFGGAADGSTYSFINRIIGSSGSDTLTGGALDDYLDAGVGGAASITGGGGNNTLVGGSTGSTDFYPSTGNATIIGGAGSDTLRYNTQANGVNKANVVNFTSAGHDFTYAGVLYHVDAYSGTATTSSGTNAFINGDSRGDYYQVNGSGATQLNTIDSQGSSIIFYNNDVDSVTVNLSGSADYVFGGAANENLNANSSGADRLDGGGGVNSLSTYGGTSETIYLDGTVDIDGNGRADYLDHGANLTTLTDSTLGVTYTGFRYDGSTGFSSTFGTSIGLIKNFQSVGGSSASDLIVGDNNNNTLSGNNGNDTIYGVGGANVINGGSGNDVLYGGTGSDVVYGGDDNDTLYGGSAGADYLYGGNSNDLLVTTSTLINSVVRFDGGNDVGTNDTLQAPGWTFSAGTLNTDNAKFVSLETLDVRNNAGGGTYSLTYQDIQAFADNGTASNITLKLDSGDTFTASTVGGGTVLNNGNDYRYFSDTGHTNFNDTTTLRAEVIVTVG